MEKERKKKIYICKEDRILIVPFPLARDLYRLPFVFLSANYTADDNWGKVSRLNRSDSQKRIFTEMKGKKSIMNSSCPREFVQYFSSIVRKKKFLALLLFSRFIFLILYIQSHVTSSNSYRSEPTHLSNRNIREPSSEENCEIRLTFDRLYNSSRNRFILRFTSNLRLLSIQRRKRGRGRKFFFSFPTTTHRRTLNVSTVRLHDLIPTVPMEGSHGGERRDGEGEERGGEENPNTIPETRGRRPLNPVPTPRCR